MNSPRFSPSPAADALYAQLADAALAYFASLRPAACAVVLQGSAASGEAWAVREESGAVRLLSDLDFAAILETDSDRDAWRMHAAEFPHVMAMVPGADHVAAPWSVGLYTREGLAAQLPKMGTLDLALGAQVLAGDPGVLAAVEPREPAAITVAESLRLLCVRAHEWGRAEDEGGGAEAVLAAAVKLVADAGTALLAAHGQYRVGAAARRAAMAELWATDARTLAEAAPELPGRIRAAQDVRLREARWPEVAAALGLEPTHDHAMDSIRRAAHPVLRAAGTWLAEAAAQEWGAPAEAPAGDTVRAALADPSELPRSLHLWLAAAPAGAGWRAWTRVARHASSPSGAARILRMARAHRLGPPPWAVAAALTLEAANAEDPAARAAARATWHAVAEN